MFLLINQEDMIDYLTAAWWSSCTSRNQPPCC